MRMSTRGRYALRAMVDLAANYGEGPVLLKEIAERQGISLKYLDHIIGPIRVVGMIKRVRGGYVLSRSPDKITSLEIIVRVEGSLAPVPCVDDPGACDRTDHCSTFELWKKVRDSIERTLGEMTLEDLARVQERNR